MSTLTGTIQIRRDTAANFIMHNPVLKDGEFAFESDTGKVKKGNGSTAWTVLTYYSDPLVLSAINDESVARSVSDTVLQNNLNNAISNLKDGVPSPGDTLNKLYNLILGSFQEIPVSNIAARDAYNAVLGMHIFVTDDGDGKWALYKATTSGINATYVKLSDPDLLNALLTASQIKIAYESNSDTNAFTNALLAKLNGIATGATANSSDATLLNRANHTGTQAISTVSGLQAALDAKEATANKDASGGYAGLTGYKLDLKNNAGTFTSLLQNVNTAIRNYTLPDKDITVAGIDDVYFILPILANGWNPADNTTYFSGLAFVNPTTVDTNHQFKPGYSFTVIGAFIQCGLNSTQGTSESATLKIRNITQNSNSTIGTFQTNATATVAVNANYTGLNIAVGANDFIALQMDSPNYATNPIATRVSAYLFCKRS